MAHKAGFVNIIGSPNVGKSTLMNSLIGEKLSIITSKAQTTRHRIMGIVNADDFQIVYSDTPGYIDKAHYKLHEQMMAFLRNAIEDADLFMFVIDNTGVTPDKLFIDKLAASGVPVILIINKIELFKDNELEATKIKWQTEYPNFEIIEVSAINFINLDVLILKILSKLPECPPYFPKEDLSDKTERFFASEIIREKILLNYDKEIPYSVEIIVDGYKDEENIAKISATIYVARESQKGIVIGHQGKSLKKVGTEARLDIEKFIGKKVFLEMHVKVAKNWRNDDKLLKRFGYNM